MIPHKYVNASDAPGQYAADLIGRQAVTIAWYLANMPGKPAWVYSEEADNFGCDPWMEIEGVDCDLLGAIHTIELVGKLDEYHVRASREIFVQRCDLPGKQPRDYLCCARVVPGSTPGGSTTPAT
jgi:hypothetical protein